ncbi:hypothetical protein MSAN_01784400 [Mycena sanguinolenta]|uniref:F-box domain-containing protein n=1 Tax=Mycena sanguinolenta TaxID=230812 RepID=A0A8H6XXW3_9AGAR|nr:hypothetical protein MSAN_01784400 [Mycena sanguinolenta]
MSLSNSPFANRLNTNYVPSDSEVLEIRALVLDPSAEIARIDTQIEALEITLGQLKEQRAALKGPIDAHKALISPMRRIPQDVLLEIFFACLPTEHNAVIDPAEAPLVLGRISRHWRDVAYSVPMLWSSIHIPALNYSLTPPNILLRLEKIVEAWLERSATCPLSVSLIDHTDYTDPNLDMNPLIHQLFAVSRRLRRLALTGDTLNFRPLLQLGPEDLPQLKGLQMRYMANNPDLDPTNIFQVPTLEDVALFMTGSIDPLSTPLPWSHLTSLRFECYGLWTNHGQEGGLDFNGALDLLRRCPNLERCEIRATKYLEHYNGLTSPIILPHLHTLILRGLQSRFQAWISDLVVPKIRSLRIGDMVSDNTTISLTGDGYLSVDLDVNRFTSIGLRELLQSFPMISRLRLFSDPFYPPEPTILDEAFIELFCPPHNLCPMLADITFTGPCAGFSDAAVLAFIKARMAMPTPLQRIRAQFGRPKELDVMPELQSYISDGFQASFEYPPPTWAFKPREGLDGLWTLY